jgi:hypothetical protein
VTVSVDAVDSVLSPLREGFQADGADLAVDEATDSLVRVRLVVTEETCHECILPGDVLTQILEATVRTSFPDIDRFEFSDPRS